MSNLMELVDTGEKLVPNDKNVSEALEKAREVGQLGFDELAALLGNKAALASKMNKIAYHGYIKITPQKITAFLEKKAEAYNKEHRKKDGSLLQRMMPSPASELSGRYSRELSHIQQVLTESLYRDAALSSAIYPGWGRGLDIETDDVDEVLSAQTAHYTSSNDAHIGKYVWTETKIQNYKSLPPANILKTLEEHKARQVFDAFTIASVNAVKDPLLLGRIKETADRFFIAQWGEDVCLDDII